MYSLFNSLTVTLLLIHNTFVGNLAWRYVRLMTSVVVKDLRLKDEDKDMMSKDEDLKIGHRGSSRL